MSDNTAQGAVQEDRLLTRIEVARMFGVDTKTVTRWAQAGKLPAAHRTAGGHRRYRESDVRTLMRGES